MSLPVTYLYTSDHEWADEKDGIIRIGITDHAARELGDIVYVELPAEGDELTAGDSFGSIESVKAVSDLYAPVSGTVVEINEELEDAPELINESPFNDGWMIVVKPSAPEQLEELMDATTYQAHLDEIS